MVRKSQLQKKTKKTVLKRNRKQSKKQLGGKDPSCKLEYGMSFKAENGGMLNVNALLSLINENPKSFLQKYKAIYIMKNGNPIAYLEGSDRFHIPKGPNGKGDELNANQLQVQYGSDEGITLVLGNFLDAKDCNKNTL